MQANTYSGKWRLIPELCIYAQGEPPKSGSYEVDENSAGEVSISVQWTSADDSEHSIRFAGPTDGSKQAFDAPGLTHFNFTRIDERTLDSSAYDGDTEVMYARRRISADNKLLSNVQETILGEKRFRNFQVYRRV